MKLKLTEGRLDPDWGTTFHDPGGIFECEGEFLANGRLLDKDGSIYRTGLKLFPINPGYKRTPVGQNVFDIKVTLVADELGEPVL